MPLRTDRAEYWKDCARTARAQAEHLHDRDAREQILKIAEAYDRLAERASLRREPDAVPRRAR